MFVQGARHSENLYLIYNMNSICRLCKSITNIFPQIPIINFFNKLNKRNWTVNHCHFSLRRLFTDVVMKYKCNKIVGNTT